VPFGGVVASGLALGTGGSGGREGPIVLIGGSVGSLVGRLLALDEERMRTVVAAGAAAGIGASFNAPIGGMLFAIEVLIGRFRTSALQTVVVASVVGSVTAREVIGPEIIYEPATLYKLTDARELLLYAMLGLAAGLFGVVFLYGEEFAKHTFARMTIWPPLKLAIGGLGVGLVALAIPEVIGTGDNLPPIDGLRNPINTILDQQFGTGYMAVGLLLLLAFAKLVTTCLSIGSGNAVGGLAPAIFCGAALGSAVGHIAQELLPNAGVQPGAFALAGMAAVFTATARAPLTAIVIAFELTGNYEMVLPLMLATGLATFLADRIQPESVYTLPLRRRGIVYADPEDVDIMQAVRVDEVMTTDPDVLAADLPLDEARQEFRETRHHGFPVVRNGRLIGICTLADLARAPANEEFDGLAEETLTVADICTRQPLTVTPTDPVFRAVRRMASIDVGRLPVVATEDHGQLVGLVRRSDVVKAYQRALTQSVAAQQRKQTRQLRDLAGTQVIEFRVAGDAQTAGRRVRDVAWPPRTILTGVCRDGEVITPNGDTMLQADDEVTVLTNRVHVDAVQHLFAHASTRPTDTHS
jgi:CIC family chloride channel protein